MHNKKSDNNKSHNFLQGLRPFSSSIPRELKSILKKGGYNFTNIVDNWTKMIGKDISNNCYPSTVKVDKNLSDATLILNVIHGKEMDIEYNKKIIIDKINSFFGYNYIKQIKLKIIQEEKKYEKMNTNSKKMFKKLEKKLSSIQNSNLKNSLNKLVKAYDQKKF